MEGAKSEISLHEPSLPIEAFQDDGNRALSRVTGTVMTSSTEIVDGR